MDVAGHHDGALRHAGPKRAGARPRWLVTVGLAGLVVGAIDPLEGSVVILIGSAFVAFGTQLDGSRYRRIAAWGLALVLIGFSVMVTVTAIGGVGGSTGRSPWWATLVTPFAVGWFLGIVAGARAHLDLYRDRPRG